MRIGSFAAATGLSRDTIRFYEQQGLLRPQRVGDGGYRHYAAADVDRCAMIRLGQQLGFSLRQIRELADAWDSGRLTPARKRAELDARLLDLDARIAALKRMRAYVRAKLDWMERGSHGLPPTLADLADRPPRRPASPARARRAG
jgi:DNA-binding transcriptional MerR regulator